MRLTKFVALTSRLRLQGNLDLYNAFNFSSILTIGTAYRHIWAVVRCEPPGHDLAVRRELVDRIHLGVATFVAKPSRIRTHWTERGDVVRHGTVHGGASFVTDE